MVKNIGRAQVSGRELATTMKGSTLMSTTRILWTLLVTTACSATRRRSAPVRRAVRLRARHEHVPGDRARLRLPRGAWAMED
jgi:hypothetical protein